MLEAMLHVAARFSGCGETGVTPCHAATRGAEELQTDLTSVEMLNHKVMRRWQAPALYGSQKPTLTTSNLVCLPCSITTRNVTSVEAGWSPSTPPRTFLGQRNSCAVPSVQQFPLVLRSCKPPWHFLTVTVNKNFLYIFSGIWCQMKANFDMPVNSSMRISSRRESSGNHSLHVNKKGKR